MNEALAARLWEARRTGGQTEVPAGERPATLEEAYAVQAGITRLAGLEVAGWKIGATAEAAMKLLGVDAPFFGPLYRQWFHDSGALVPLAFGQGPGLETEFVVGLGRDLPPREAPWEPEEVAEAVAWVAPGFEVVGPRFAGGLPGAGLLAIADGGVNIDFVLGPRHEAWRELDLGGHEAVLSINGEERARGHSGMLLFGDPIRAVAWLASQPWIAPRGIRAGDAVTTGTCTGITPLAPGDEARADFGPMGVVSARFEAL